MKHVPWISACVGGAIGFALAAGESEGSFIAGICAAGGYIIGEVIKFILTRSADSRARRQGSEYSPKEWEDYKKNLKD
jgi:hypothetical protein